VAVTTDRSTRHLWLVAPPPVFEDPVHEDPAYDLRERAPSATPTLFDALPGESPPSITPEPHAHERWLACARPDDRLRYGAYLCDCAVCLASLERVVREHRRPGLPIVIVTEADRVATSARELLAQLEAGEGYAPLLWVVDDIVRSVYVGRGSAPRTRSEAHFAWQQRSAREGRYLPRPRLEGTEPVGRHPASLAPAAGLSLRLPRELEHRAREVAHDAGLDLETWIVEALRGSVG
jgi:hypothetical protein